MRTWPISIEDVRAARDRLRPFIVPSPLRDYAPLDDAVGQGICVLVKHDNHLPTNAFKVRNALSAMTALSDAERTRGVIAATRGNHGLGLAYAGALLGVPVVVCVPEGNNPDKNEAIKGYGAELVEGGRHYDATAAIADALAAERGLTLVHSTNNLGVIAGAGTMTLEILEDAPDLDALVVSVGGGSQAVGALTVARALKPSLRIYGVQAEGAAAIHDGWHARAPRTVAEVNTFADGIATGATYPMTFTALCEGLAGFVTVTDAEIAEAMRVLLRTTHSLVEGAGAAGLAGLFKLRDTLAGQRVGVILSGGNVDAETLTKVLDHRL